MALPVTIPNTFANATASIPLSQLDTNFTTLANAVNGISDGSETLANVTATVVNATTVDTTNIEVTNIKAKDGTAAGSIANSTGVVTLASSVLTTTDINGGTIDGTAIGGASAAAVSATTLNTSGAVVFNDAGADVDFRVEGDTDANLLFVDASTDRVGVGTSSPQRKLHIVGTDGATTFSGYGARDFLVVENNQNSNIQIVSNSANSGNVLFSDESDSNRGQISYVHSSDAMFFSTDNIERMRIDSDGNVGIGTTTPAVSGLEISKATGSATPTPVELRLSTTTNASDWSVTDPWGKISFNSSDATGSGPKTHGSIQMVADATNGGASRMEFYMDDENGSLEKMLEFDRDNTISFYTNASTERMRITSDGEVLVGGTTSINSNEGCITLQRASAQPVVSIFRSDTSIVGGDAFGYVGWYGSDTTSNTPTLHAYVQAVASGTHAAGDNPTDLVFGTTPVGSATVAEVARFTQDKYLRLASGTGGIQFGGDTAAANALDDYEEGTWTPVIADATTGGNVSPTAATSAIYTKVGRMVTVQCLFVNISTVGLTAGNDLHIRDLPFTAASVSGTMLISGSCTLSDTTFTGFVNPVIFDNNTYLRFAETISGASLDYLVVSEFSTGVADIYLNITYQAA